MPPCAVSKRKKPDFFYLNLLECRLLAPRITFQKLMQAPRGRQLKIHENIVNVPANVTCHLLCYHSYQAKLQQSKLI